MRVKLRRYKRPNWSSFHGRADRREWLRITLQSIILSGVLSALAPTLAPLLSIPFTLILLATSTRRLHDLKLSGWIQTIPMALMAASLAIFYTVQRLGLADFSRVFNRSKFDLTHPSASTFGELVKIDGGLPKLDALTLNQALPLGFLALATLAYLGLYGLLLLAAGNDGPNCYGEGD